LRYHPCLEKGFSWNVADKIAGKKEKVGLDAGLNFRKTE
jgi:hypothetical protein